MASQDPPQPQSKVQMDPNFEQRYRELKDAAKTETEARGKGEQVKWFRPGKWDGDLADFSAIGSEFGREQANDEGVEALSDPQNPGTVGDVVIAQTMIDTLSAMERAFRTRHTMTRPRAMAHMLARKRGHGQDTGALMNNGVEFVRELLKQARAAS